MSSFVLPEFCPPDFTKPPLDNAPVASFKKVTISGVAPEDYHATSIYPEYFQVKKGQWILPKESRMDSVVVLRPDGSLSVTEFRLLRPGDLVACGRRENGEDGIYVHTSAFGWEYQGVSEKFAFRTQISRETSFSIDYDELYGLLAFERDNGFILWVLGPAVAFDKDAREALSGIIEAGFVHGVLAGNALATHDIEAALFGTALGQDIYSKRHAHLGHYKHLDTINLIRNTGSIEEAVKTGMIKDGIMASVVRKQIPYVLAGSIRDDGPLPGVVADAYQAQDRMRLLARKSTTVIAMATQLHSIATGNMTPSYRVMENGLIRPVYFFTVDMSEFAVNKLINRGSLSARSILTNTQDFVVNLHRKLIRGA
jgi:lysine-ketoglutarate reductase/saccharopine dehydrogenase-like protein (TIGR00300 family)